jgi:hypothetical protein
VDFKSIDHGQELVDQSGPLVEDGAQHKVQETDAWHFVFEEQLEVESSSRATIARRKSAGRRNVYTTST